MNIIFMGTSDFAVPSLQVLIKNNFDIIAVYTQPPRPAGRGKKLKISSVGKCAIENNLKLLYPENFSSPSEIEFFKSLQPDLVIVIAYGLILPNILLNFAKIGFFNVHASLLPRWRGAAPIQRALLAGDKEIGVSIIKLEPSLDTGPIVLKSPLMIESVDNAGSLHNKLSIIGANLTHQLLNNIINLNYQVQDTVGVTYAKKIEKSELKIDWCDDAQTIIKKIKAFSPSPGAWFFFGGERIKILDCNVLKGKGKPGLVLDHCFQIACGNGSIIPTIFQRPGKVALTSDEFLKGYKVPVGETLK